MTDILDENLEGLYDENGEAIFDELGASITVDWSGELTGIIEEFIYDGTI